MSMSGDAERQPHLFLVAVHVPSSLIGWIEKPVS